MSADVECLQRAVEGRASSDEEEEDRGLREEGLSGTKSSSRVHSWGKGFAFILIICLKRQAEALITLNIFRCQNQLVHPHGLHSNKRCCSWNGQKTELFDTGKVGMLLYWLYNLLTKTCSSLPAEVQQLQHLIVCFLHLSLISPKKTKTRLW